MTSARLAFNRLLAETTPLCRDDSAWVSDHAPLREAVAPLCADCPLLAACAACAAEERPAHGVWAGRDYSQTTVAGRKRKTPKSKTPPQQKENTP